MIYAHHFSGTRHKQQLETLVTKVSDIVSVFLFLLIVCISVVVNRHFELNSWAAQYSNCSLELTKIAAECGKQHEELESCQKELYDAKFLMQEMQFYKNQAAVNAEKRDLCDKHLRRVEGKVYQLIHNITVRSCC